MSVPESAYFSLRGGGLVQHYALLLLVISYFSCNIPESPLCNKMKRLAHKAGGYVMTDYGRCFAKYNGYPKDKNAVVIEDVPYIASKTVTKL